MERTRHTEQTQDTQQAQFERMTRAPIPGLIASLALPAVASMLVSALYNMTDTFFVSKLGSSATGAVGIVFPVMVLIQAAGFAVGQGAGSIISRRLGEGAPEDAGKAASGALLLSLLLGALVAVGGLAFLEPALSLLGATPTMLPHARDYARYILLAAPLTAGAFVLNNTLRAEGKTNRAMVGIVAGSILNVALDPLFIFVLGWGTAGNAIATGIGQAVSFALLLLAYLRKKTTVVLSWKAVPRKRSVYMEILRMGAPAFLRQGLASAAAAVLNLNARAYGDAAVAAMSIVAKLFMFIFSVSLGIGQGYQPMCGYNYGAKLYARVRQGYRFTLMVGVAVMTLLAGAAFLFAPQLMSLFIRDDPVVIQVGVRALRAQCLAMPLVPVAVVINMTFQSVGHAGAAAFLSACRQGICFLPLIILLPRAFGLFGVETAQAFADALTFAISLPMSIRYFKKLPRENAKNVENGNNEK